MTQPERQLYPWTVSATGDVAEQQAAGEAAPVTDAVRPSDIPDGRLPAELDEWERQNFDRETFLAGLREVEQTGGLRLQDFIQELEGRVESDD